MTTCTLFQSWSAYRFDCDWNEDSKTPGSWLVLLQDPAVLQECDVTTRNRYPGRARRVWKVRIHILF